MNRGSGQSSRRITVSTGIAVGASVLAVLAIVIAVRRHGSGNTSTTTSQAAGQRMLATATATSTVTVTASPSSSAVTVTRTVHADATPQTAAHRHVPQGTVTETFMQDGDIDTNCTDVTITVDNRSDTAVLTVTLSFKTSYSGYPTPNSSLRQMLVSAATAPETVPAGVPPHSERDVRLRECVTAPFHVDEPDRSFTDAIPVSFSWKWAS
jgi:hypothetical protein